MLIEKSQSFYVNLRKPVCCDPLQSQVVILKACNWTRKDKTAKEIRHDLAG
jgi:hypothetical protein